MATHTPFLRIYLPFVLLLLFSWSRQISGTIFGLESPIGVCDVHSLALTQLSPFSVQTNADDIISEFHYPLYCVCLILQRLSRSGAARTFPYG